MKQNLIRRYYLQVAALLLVVSSCDRFYVTDVGDFLATGRTLSHFTAIQVDPPAEDSAGPQFVVAADLNSDGLIDLVSAWNQSQPVQIHLQRLSPEGERSFETVTLAGSVPVVQVAGLAVEDLNLDGRQDVIVLAKFSLQGGATCINGQEADGLDGLIITYLGPADQSQANQALAWDEVMIGSSLLAGSGSPDTPPVTPELDGFTGLAVGDITADGLPDIVVAYNSACEDEGGNILLFTNLGPTSIQDGTWVRSVLTDPLPGGGVRDVQLGDIDRDGDLDIVFSRPDAGTMNVRWFRNPTIDIPDDVHISNGEWQIGTIGQVSTKSDIVRLADVDEDGFLDVIVRSSGGAVIQWFKAPETPTSQPVRNIPWQVYTMAEFLDRIPEGMALGDITGNGKLELVVGAQGGLAFYRSSSGYYKQWKETMILDDIPGAANNNAPATTDPAVASGEIAGGSSIHTVIIVDLDQDGRNDIVVTLNREGLSGLTNDALVWLRNTK